MKHTHITQYLFEKKRSFVAFLISTLILAVVAPLKSYILQWLLDSGSMKEAISYLVLGIGITLLSHVTEIISRRTYIRMANHSVKRIRGQVTEALARQPIRTYLETDTGSYLSLLTNDIKSIYDNYYMPIFDVVMWGGMGLVALVMLASINPWIMIMAVVMSFIPLMVPKMMSKVISQYRKDFSNSDAAYTGKMNELLHGFETLTLSSSKSWLIHWQEKAAADNAEKDYALQTKLSLSQVVMSFISWLPSLMVLFVGVILVFENKITLSSLITANTLLAFVLSPMRSVSKAYASWKSALPVKEKIEAAMEIPEQTSGEPIRQIQEGFELDIREFTYPGGSQPALTDVSLSFEAGAKIAVVGESGSGKSTLARLLLKYYDDYSGRILVDGKELRTIDTERYYGRIAVIPQKCVVFSGTMRENICLGMSCTEEQLCRALEQAGLKEFVNSLPDGVDTILSEEGKNLSGGQSQRISIARALLRQCDVMIVDEATSSLDTKTTQEIMERLLRLHCSVLVITHDIFGDYMRRFDTIYYMEAGQIRERGKFDDLINQNMGFTKLYEKML